MSSRGRFPLFVAGSAAGVAAATEIAVAAAEKEAAAAAAAAEREAAAETATSAGGPAEDLTLASDMPTESFLLGGAWCSIALFSSVVYAVVASGPSLLTLRFWIVFQN